MPEELEKAIREMPRTPRWIDLIKKFPARARFPLDNCKENPDSGLPPPLLALDSWIGRSVTSPFHEAVICDGFIGRKFLLIHSIA